MTAAAQLIRHMRESVLCIDEEWVVDYEKGFRWWPHLLKQEIFVSDQRTVADGSRLDKVVVSTDVCSLKEPGMVTHPGIIELTNLATMSGLVAHGGKLRLHAHAWVDGSNLPLYKMVLGTVAGIQISEAALIARLLQEDGLGEPDTSAHPTSGLREEPDEITSVVEALIAPMGDGDPPWPREMLDDVRETYMDQPPCLMAISDPSGLTAEFPFGEESSLLRVNLTQNHPLLGNGMMVSNTFNVENLDDPLLENPIGMNGWEVEHGDGPFLGSWQEQDSGSMSFVSFVPNALKHPAAASNFVILAGARARRMAMKWLGDDWSKTWDSEGNCVAKTAIERMMHKLGGNTPPSHV